MRTLEFISEITNFSLYTASSRSKYKLLYVQVIIKYRVNVNKFQANNNKVVVDLYYRFY